MRLLASTLARMDTCGQGCRNLQPERKDCSGDRVGCPSNCKEARKSTESRVEKYHFKEELGRLPTNTPPDVPEVGHTAPGKCLRAEARRPHLMQRQEQATAWKYFTGELHMLPVAYRKLEQKKSNCLK